MNSEDSLLNSELDATSASAFFEQQMGFTPTPYEMRVYPGYPTILLPKPRACFAWLETALWRRRCTLQFAARSPTARDLADVLHLSHCLFPMETSVPHGPTPSAGGLHAIEVYLLNRFQSWLPAAGFHYHRHRHLLAQLQLFDANVDWQKIIPSLVPITQGGAMVVVLVGNTIPVREKYGDRGDRLLLLEAGHVMQTFCLVAAARKMAMTPLGGFQEVALRRLLQLPETDLPLYLGLLGYPA